MASHLRSLFLYALIILASLQSIADNELHTDYFRRIACSPNKSSKERIDAFKSLIKDNPKAIDDPLAFDIVDLLLSMREYERADSVLDMISQNKHLCADSKCRLLSLQCQTAFNRQNYERVMDYALELLKESKSDTLSYRNADAYVRMADVFNLLGNYTFGERCARRAFKILDNLKHPDNWRKTQSLICLSNSLLGLDKRKEAFEILKQGRELATDSIHINALLGTLGLLYCRNGDIEMAENYYLDALETPGNRINSGAQILNLLSLKLTKGEYGEAREIIENHSDLLSDLDNPNMRRGVNQVKAYIFAHEGNMEDAFIALDSALAQADSAHKAERDIYNKQLSSQFEERLMKIENGDHKSLNLYILCGVIGSVIVIALFGWLIRREKAIQAKKHAQLQLQIENLEEQLRTSNNESNADIELKNKSLLGMSMHLARITEGLEKIDALTSDNAQSIDQRMLKIRSLLRQLDSEDNLWEMFKIYFEEVNQSFFNNLYKVQPNLTNAEVRMSAFILMNLTSKEIATLTNRSVRTVESIKYNLRKKLSITEPTELFMRRVATSHME